MGKLNRSGKDLKHQIKNKEATYKLVKENNEYREKHGERKLFSKRRVGAVKNSWLKLLGKFNPFS